MDQASKKPKIDKMVDSLSEMSKIFYQIILLTDCLDRLVDTETSTEKIKANVKSFVVALERIVKHYRSFEMVLTSYFKDEELDFSNISLNEDSKKDASSSKAKASTNISLRLQTSKFETIFEKMSMSPDREIIQLHGQTMERLFVLTDTKQMIVDKSGIYQRIHFLQGENPVEIRESSDFGSISTIYITSPDFPEIKRLSGWIKEGVKDNFENNPMIKIDDTIALDFFSASPDFDSSQTYPVWHFIKMRKVRYEKSMISNAEKIFRSFTEENIHYRRGLGLIVVKGHKCFKKALHKLWKT